MGTAQDIAFEINKHRDVSGSRQYFAESYTRFNRAVDGCSTYVMVRDSESNTFTSWNIKDDQSQDAKMEANDIIFEIEHPKN